MAKALTRLTAPRPLPAVALLGLALLGLALFAPLPQSYYRMVSWPTCLVWQLSFLLLAGLLWGQLRRRWPWRPLGYGVDWLVLGSAAAALVASLFAFSKPVALQALLLGLGYVLLLYVGRNALPTAGLSRQGLGWLLGLTGFLTAAVSLAHWQPSGDMWRGDFHSALRNAMPLGHHNFVGGYFALVLPLLVALALGQQGWRRWMVGAGAAVVAAALYVSGSRGAALGVLMWLLVSSAAWVVSGSPRQRRRRLLLAVAGLGLGLIALGSNPRIRGLIASIQLGGDAPLVGDTPTLDRWFMLQIAGNVVRSHPLFGVGPGNLGRVSNLYRPLETGTGLDHIQQLHNLPAQLLAELGLLGGLVYVSWLGLLGYWVIRLWRRPLSPQDRYLLAGVGGSYLAYGCSSLTDYQLENIAIATSLALLLLIVIFIADAYETPPPPLRHRRPLSFVALAVLLTMIYGWLPFDLALGLGQSAQAAAEGQLAVAENRWQKATSITPWDPTFSALALEKLLEVGGASATAQASTFQDLTLGYARSALAAAPYDVWFNQNLARLLPAEQGIPYAERAAQLLPRNENFTYFLLGQLYLAQGQRQRAVTAFALEALGRPEILTYRNWEMLPLLEIRQEVVAATLAEYDRLLAQLADDHPAYPLVLERRTLLAWWIGEAAPRDLSRLRPSVRALLQSQLDPAAALDTVETAMAENATAALRLLAAWLAPQRYLEDYLADQPETQRLLLRQQILTHRTLNAWLQSAIQRPPQLYRGALAFAYRNQAANQIRLMLRPDGLQAYSLVQDLDLFPPWPREFPALDRQMESLRSQRLGLPHPTRAQFTLTPETLP